MNKKIDCWKNLTGETSEHFVTALQFDDEKSYKEAVRYFKESFEFALTQQRTALLEEILELIEKQPPIMRGKWVIHPDWIDKRELASLIISKLKL